MSVRGLPRFSRGLGGRRLLADAAAQGFHQVYDVAASRALLRRDRFAGALLVEEIDQRLFVVILELLWFEVCALLVDDMLGAIEHVLRQFHVLDIIEILGFGSHLVGVAQKHANEALPHRFECDDVLAASQHYAADCDHVHVADRLPDDGIGVVSNLAVRGQIIGTDDVALVDLLALDELVDLDGAGGFQRYVFEFVLCHLDVGVVVDLVALDDLVVRDFLARLRVDARVLDPMTGVFVDLVERILSASDVAGYSATGQVTSDRRRKPFQLARGAMYAELLVGGSDSRPIDRHSSDIPDHRNFETRKLNLQVQKENIWIMSAPSSEGGIDGIHIYARSASAAVSCRKLKKARCHLR